MSKSDKTSVIFSKCLTSICLAVFEAEDKVIKEKLNQFVNKLLISFISVKNKGENQVTLTNILQFEKEQVANYPNIVQHDSCVAQPDILKHPQQNVSKYPNIVQRNTYVAQYWDDIFFAQIDGLIGYLELLSHLKKTKTASPLLAVKNLLFLKISILNSQKIQFIAKKEIKPKEKQEKNQKTNSLAEEIFDFISKNEQPSNNKAIFSNFSKTSIRTLRRHIKILLSAKIIRRHQNGKIVTYTVTR